MCGVPLNLALAVSLLSSPLDLASVDVPLSSIRRVALAMELVDKSERKLTHGDVLHLDLYTIRSRYRSLRGAPPVIDAVRFGLNANFREALEYNRAHRKWLVDRRCLDSSPQIEEAIWECDELRAIYDAADVATSDTTLVVDRRLALERLRRLVGANNYYEGILPPCVPVWRFNWIE